MNNVKIAKELLKIAKNIVAYNMSDVKIESIKYGEICLSCELKFDNDSSISEVVNGLNLVSNQIFKSIKTKLDSGNLLDFDTGYTRVEINHNIIIAKMYYCGQFDIN